MRILLDENLPRGLKHELPDHEIATVPEMGWSGTRDSELLRRAAGHFDVLVTADRNLEFQQNIAAASIGVVVVVAPNTRMQTLRPLTPAILSALTLAKGRTLVRVPGEPGARD